ncbi:hypothetical protein P5673_025727 [Acropora cervicornis]|uniref:Uncharacterized protein n=1 Tax=Acropora cervicornis TaxID=6130 RepID=A0AAD9UWW9_ACRCE|nr:hypothetical protein P5673_025727 [Acropora cervicornis]
MKRVKSYWRCTLGKDTMDMLMRVKIEGPKKQADYRPRAAVNSIARFKNVNNHIASFRFMLEFPSIQVSGMLLRSQVPMYLLERTRSASTINTAFYAINWAHKLAGLESPTDHPTVLLIEEGAVRTCSQKCNRKEPLEPDHLKGLASQTNFEDLLPLRSLVLYVLSFCGFLRSAKILELHHNSISFKNDHMEISIVKSKTDQLSEGGVQLSSVYTI